MVAAVTPDASWALPVGHPSRGGHHSHARGAGWGAGAHTHTWSPAGLGLSARSGGRVGHPRLPSSPCMWQPPSPGSARSSPGTAVLCSTLP